MKKKVIIGTSLILLLTVCIIIIKGCRKKESGIIFETVKVKKGTVSNIITATGTIEALKTVEVGTQVSGEISKIYVDFNSEVKAGQLLAVLDLRPLRTALTIAEASLDDAKAEMTYQEANYKRIKALKDKSLVADAEYDQVLYNYERAKTALKTAQLNYDKAKINLEYAYIYSPIDGVILNRAVDEGQTVAASFSTPTLFTIANDLTRMQVEASVDEADIGQVRNNQRVEFTVDAYPDQKFAGVVTQIRLEPVVASNVVTYTVIVEASNPDKKLMPGMTASITIFVSEVNDVLTVSCRALRFKPTQEQLSKFLPNKKEPQQVFTDKKRLDPPMKKGLKESDRDDYTSNKKEVWVKDGNNIHPVFIETGLSNDIDVQIISGLKEGDEVIVSMITTKRTGNAPEIETNASSPFMPKPPSARTKK